MSAVIFTENKCEKIKRVARELSRLDACYGSDRSVGRVIARLADCAVAIYGVASKKSWETEYSECDVDDAIYSLERQVRKLRRRLRDDRNISK
ncbi:MAG: hypothetical protein IJO40_03630 [Thermoguttaceae bacterium]|jgi:ribosome-associated translation inhibitor RaiA|nr:hypothetical protein [Thermoguttaceae bacterium]